MVFGMKMGWWDGLYRNNEKWLYDEDVLDENEYFCDFFIKIERKMSFMIMLDFWSVFWE